MKLSRKKVTTAAATLVVVTAASWSVLAYARSQDVVFPGTIAPGAHDFKAANGSAQFCLDCHAPLPAGHPQAADPCLRCHAASPGAHAASRHGDGAACETCHGTTDSHAVHVVSPSKSAVAPLACASCHDVTFYTSFSDGLDLSGTSVCNACHSPGIPYDGVNSVGGSIGAKDNWASGIYDGSDAITAGKERWCAGCHDASVGGKRDIVGSGFYTTGHGKAGTPSEECTTCHDTTQTDYPLKASFTSANFYSGSAATALALCFDCHSYSRYHDGNGDNTFGEHKKHVDKEGVSCYACHAASHTRDYPGATVLPNNMIRVGGGGPIYQTSGSFAGNGACWADDQPSGDCHGGKDEDY